MPGSQIVAERYHDISCGHRVVGHEGKCRHLHGHNYRITFTIEGERDGLGRVLDFSVIKTRLCEWLETNWDHKLLLWSNDPVANILLQSHVPDLYNGVVVLPFNPTAEGMADYLLNDVGPIALYGTGASLIKVRVEETRKCSATAERKG